MTETTEPWLVAQLARMARVNPERFETFLRRLQANQPEIFEELALMAVDSGVLTTPACAACLATDEASVVVRLEIYRQVEDGSTSGVLVETDESRVARVSGTGVSVWEIVYKYRELGSIEALKEAYPGLTDGELRAALRYADRYPDEVELQISKYEKMVERARAAYPFS